MAEQPGTIARVGRAVSSLMQIHVEVAQREAARDRSRLVSGVVYFTIALALLLGFVLMGHVAMLFAIKQWGLAFHWGALSIMGADLLLLVIFLLLAKSSFAARLLPETRSLLARTWTAILNSGQETPTPAPSSESN